MNIKMIKIIIMVFIMIVIWGGCGAAADKAGTSGKSEKADKSGEEQKDKKTSETEVVGIAKSKIPGQNDFILINLGKKDNIKIGQEFIISRGKTYICTIVVTKMYDTSAIGRIIPESINQDKNGTHLQVKEGDKATRKNK